MGYLALFAQLWPVIEAAVKAVEIVQADSGKPVGEVIVDVVNHLTPGAPGAPALSESASPPGA